MQGEALFPFVSPAVDLDDLFFRGLAGIGQAADVLHGVLGHSFKVLRLDPQLLQVGRDAHLLADGADGLDRLGGGVAGGEAFDLLAHSLGQIPEAVKVADEVEFLHIGQQDGVAYAVRQVVVAAQLVGHGVDVAQRGVIESNARQILGVGHLVPGLHVVAVGHRLGQVLVDHLHRHQGGGVGEYVGGGGDIGLNGVGHGVHTGGGGEGSGHPLHEDRVVDGDLGGDSPVHNGHFHLAGGVGDDAETGDLRGGAGGGVDGHQGDHVLGGLVHALVVVDGAAVAGHQADALGAVVGGAAAQRDDRVAVVGVEEGHASFDIFIGGVGFGAVKDHRRDPGIRQDPGDAADHVRLSQELVGDDHGVLDIQAHKQGADFLDSSLAEHVSSRQVIISRH